jgi:hypothetical protein
MPEMLLTFAQAAERAANSVAWWRKLAARRQIRVIKLGRSARLRSDDVDRIIREGFRAPQSAEESEHIGQRVRR